jgi:hypothetical protein
MSALETMQEDGEKALVLAAKDFDAYRANSSYAKALWDLLSGDIALVFEMIRSAPNTYCPKAVFLPGRKIRDLVLDVTPITRKTVTVPGEYRFNQQVTKEVYKDDKKPEKGQVFLWDHSGDFSGIGGHDKEGYYTSYYCTPAQEILDWWRKVVGPIGSHDFGLSSLEIIKRGKEDGSYLLLGQIRSGIGTFWLAVEEF